MLQALAGGKEPVAQAGLQPRCTSPLASSLPKDSGLGPGAPAPESSPNRESACEVVCISITGFLWGLFQLSSKAACGTGGGEGWRQLPWLSSPLPSAVQWSLSRLMAPDGPADTSFRGSLSLGPVKSRDQDFSVSRNLVKTAHF